MTALKAATEWVQRGFFPIPIPHRQKKPILEQWQMLRITAEADLPAYFGSTPQNIGVLLGDDHGSADIDCDCAEAVVAAVHLAPETGMIFGRRSKPSSHFFYRCHPPVRTRKFIDPVDKTTLVELRCQKRDGTVGMQTVVPPSVHESGEPIEFKPGFDRQPAKIDSAGLEEAVCRIAAASVLARHWPAAGHGRHECEMALAGVLARVGWEEWEASQFVLGTYQAVPSHDPNAIGRVAKSVQDSFRRHAEGIEITGIPRLLESIGEQPVKAALNWLGIVRASPAAVRQENTPSIFDKLAPYPRPLGKEAYYGLAGKFVSLVEPHTEADPNFLLISFLIHAGNLLGRDAWVWTGGDRHYANLFGCAVGPTSTGRKGSAAGPIRMFFEGVDLKWVSAMQSGLSSGEGLISAVRDPVFGREKAIKRRETTSERENICIEPGVHDKRLLVIQSEFYGALAAMKRQGNTLSAVMRDAWDKGDLRTMVKNFPAKATGAHISIIANITRDELLRGMLAEDFDNGFSNRFLWICSQRSKELPEGGKLSEVDFGPLQGDFKCATGSVKGVVRRNAEASDIWGYDDKPKAGAYHNLTRERGGMFGAVSARAAPQVLRISFIYALLDRSGEIRREHLQAALEVWRYCEESAAYIFGDATGDPTADAIMAALRSAGATGMTRCELLNFFNRNKSSFEISRGLLVLYRDTRARFEREETRGRPTERWWAVGLAAKHDDLSS